MKEHDYMMQIMAMGGLFCTIFLKEVKSVWSDGGSEQTMSFQYTKPFELHFCYHHATDDHDNLCHTIPSIEGTWVTDCWPIRIYSYLLAIKEIYTYLALKHFFFNEDPNTLPKLLNFHCELAWQIIDNFFLKDIAKKIYSEKAMSTDNIHKYAVAPHHARCFNGRV